MSDPSDDRRSRWRTWSQRDRIIPRTRQLSSSSRLLYRIDHYSSMPAVGITGVVLVVVFLVIGAALRFPNRWVVAFEVSVAAVTLMMVFTIQHTQGREQAATQRKAGSAHEADQDDGHE